MNERRPPKGYEIHVVYLGYGPMINGDGTVNLNGCAGDGEVFMTRAEAVLACWGEKMELDRAVREGQVEPDSLAELQELYGES